jgi:tRNA(Ile)-lysidine synthase
MLDFRRSEVIDYLNTLGQPFRVDRSNRDTRFTRNAIRHQLLPLLVSRFNPHAVDSIVRLGRLAGEAQQVIDSLVTDLRQRCVSQRPVPEGSISQGSMSRSPKQALAINCHALAEVPPYLVRELVRAAWREQGWRCQSMGYAEWDKLAQWIHDPASAPRRYALPGNIGMDLRGDEMLLAATSAARRSAT